MRLDDAEQSFRLSYRKARFTEAMYRFGDTDIDIHTTSEWWSNFYWRRILKCKRMRMIATRARLLQCGTT